MPKRMHPNDFIQNKQRKHKKTMFRDLSSFSTEKLRILLLGLSHFIEFDNNLFRKYLILLRGNHTLFSILLWMKIYRFQLNFIRNQIYFWLSQFHCLVNINRNYYCREKMRERQREIGYDNKIHIIWHVLLAVRIFRNKNIPGMCGFGRLQYRMSSVQTNFQNLVSIRRVLCLWFPVDLPECTLYSQLIVCGETYFTFNLNLVVNFAVLIFG